MNNEEKKETLEVVNNDAIPVVEVKPVVEPVAPPQVVTSVQQVQTPEVPIPEVPTPEVPPTIEAPSVNVQPAQTNLNQTTPVVPQTVVPPTNVQQNTQVPPTPTQPPKSGGKLKIILLILLFLLLFLVAFFIEDITAYIDNMKSGGNEKRILSGTLVCKHTTDGQTGTKETEAKFIYKNEKLQRLEMVIFTTNTDIEKINTAMEKCEQLEQEVVSLKGIDIQCSKTDSGVTLVENIDYANFDSSKLGPGFSEAGGYYPQFDKNEKIDTVSKEMIKAEYSCQKQE